jgi:L-alanine-DL-glutamate epimerase-like enolase superfamily enzyme
MGMQLFYKTINSPFQYPFAISKGRIKTEQPAILLGLQFGKYIGYGEAPAINYYNVTIDSMIATLEQYKAAIEQYAFNSAERFGHFLHHLLPNDSFVACALDMACWDLQGKLDKQPLYKLFNTNFDSTIQPATDYTLGIDTTEKMIAKMLAHPMPIYKIKSNGTNDIELITELRKHTKAAFRIDANESWTVAYTAEVMPALKELGVHMIEQPLAKTDWEGMAVLMQTNCITLIADEACVHPTDVKKCAGHFDGINIKLTKCGGITPALQMVKEAKALGLKVMMGSMNETTVGTAAVAHFLPQLDYVDMDGPLLLANDIAKGLTYNDGRVSITEKPGLGIEFIG